MKLHTKLILFLPLSTSLYLPLLPPSRKNSLVVRTQLSVRVHAIIGKCQSPKTKLRDVAHTPHCTR